MSFSHWYNIDNMTDEEIWELEESLADAEIDRQIDARREEAWN